MYQDHIVADPDALRTCAAHLDSIGEAHREDAWRVVAAYATLQENWKNDTHFPSFDNAFGNALQPMLKLYDEFTRLADYLRSQATVIEEILANDYSE